MKKVDEVLTWPGLHGTTDAVVRVRIFDDMIFANRDVVILTEPIDNPGTSVTNGAELIAALVVEKFKLDPARVSWFEHYPAQPGRMTRQATFDSVTFKLSTPGVEFRYGRNVATLGTPSWRRVEWTVVRNSISSDLED